MLLTKPVTRIDVYENFLDRSLDKLTEERLSLLSDSQAKELRSRLADFDENWVPAAKQPQSLASLFMCGLYLKDGLMMYAYPTDYLHRLALYYEQIQILYMSVTDDEQIYFGGMQRRLWHDIRVLRQLKPYVDIGAILLVPWSIAAKMTRKVNRKAVEPISKNQRLRKILDAFEPGDEDEAMAFNYDFNKYIVPLRELLRDHLIQQEVGGELIATTPLMADLLVEAYQQSARCPSLGEVWASRVAEADIVRLGETSYEDLLALRKNDEVFSNWRVRLDKVMFDLRTAISAGTSPTRSEIRRRLNGELIDAADVMARDLKKRSKIALAKESMTTFGIGASAALLVNPDPRVAIGSGAAAAGLRFLFDVISKGARREDNRIYRVFSMFAEEQHP